MKSAKKSKPVRRAPKHPTSQPSQKTFSEQIPALLPSMVPKSGLPTTEQLAQLAAVMADTDDIPAETAARALSLWNACAELLAITSKVEELTKPFLDEFPSGEEITVHLFLEKCMPKSTDRTRREKWQAFVKAEIGKDSIRVLLGMNQDNDIHVISDSDFTEIAIPPSHLLMLHDSFVTFLQKDREEQIQGQTEKSKRGKLLRSAARAVLGMQKLTEKQVSALKCLNERELVELIDRMKIPPRDHKKLRLRIRDLGFSEQIRPRRRVVRSWTPGKNP
jgi:hypothetical protein